MTKENKTIQTPVKGEEPISDYAIQQITNQAGVNADKRLRVENKDEYFRYSCISLLLGFYKDEYMNLLKQIGLNNINKEQSLDIFMSNADQLENNASHKYMQSLEKEFKPLEKKLNQTKALFFEEEKIKLFAKYQKGVK